MKPILFICSLLFLATSCKESKENNTAAETPVEVELSTAQRIANAHGYENWDQVERLAFTFNVDRGDYHSERSWLWEPKTGDVTLYTAEDTVKYNHRKVDSTVMQADAGFINDKYWLLAPFQLLWDAESSDITEKEGQIAPISGDTLNMLTITYKSEGGYTPGDAYDFYYGDDYTIKEWVFRKGNDPKPSMKTTWEDYAAYGPLNLAKTHKDSTQTLNINFTGIKVN